MRRRAAKLELVVEPLHEEPPASEHPTVTATWKPLPPVEARAQWEQLAALIRRVASER